MTDLALDPTNFRIPLPEDFATKRRARLVHDLLEIFAICRNLNFVLPPAIKKAEVHGYSCVSAYTLCHATHPLIGFKAKHIHCSQLNCMGTTAGVLRARSL